MKIKDMIVHLLFPSKCAFCGNMIEYNKTGFQICEKCMDKLEFYSAAKRCSICGSPFAADNTKLEKYPDRLICRNCFAKSSKESKIYYNKSTFAVLYNDASKFGILGFKKSRNLNALKTFSKLISLMIYNDFSSINFDYVVAVPPRKSRMIKESFDQADLLAKSVAKLIKVKYSSKMFKRIRNTEKQTELCYSDRIENVSGAFGMRKSPKLVKNKTVLVIDDVSTTGSTLNETARVLKRAGASRVYIASIAKTAVK